MDFGAFKIVFFNISGVSNSPFASIVLPANISNNFIFAISPASDNGSFLNGTAFGSGNTGNNYVMASPSAVSSWTSIGTKSIYGWFLYK